MKITCLYLLESRMSIWQSRVCSFRHAIAPLLQDCRVLPDRIFGLELGDAEYIRNAGGMSVGFILLDSWAKPGYIVC